MPKSENTGEYEIYPKIFHSFIPLNLVKEHLKNGNVRLNLSYQGCAKNGICYRPQTKIYDIFEKFGKFSIIAFEKEQKDETNPEFTELSEDQSIANELNSKNFLSRLRHFLAGLLLSLTPCVFPMIPILSSIIVSRAAA